MNNNTIGGAIKMKKFMIEFLKGIPGDILLIVLGLVVGYIFQVAML